MARATRPREISFLSPVAFFPCARARRRVVGAVGRFSSPSRAQQTAAVAAAAAPPTRLIASFRPRARARALVASFQCPLKRYASPSLFFFSFSSLFSFLPHARRFRKRGIFYFITSLAASGCVRVRREQQRTGTIQIKTTRSTRSPLNFHKTTTGAICNGKKVHKGVCVCVCVWAQ